MKTQWYKGLDSDAKEEMINHYKGSGILRKRLSQIIEDKIDAKTRESLNASDYELSNWAYKQADSVGYRRALQEIISLIE